MPVVSGSYSNDGFVDIRLNPDSKTTEIEVVSIATHNVPTKAGVIETDDFQPTGKRFKLVEIIWLTLTLFNLVKIDRSAPVFFPAIPVIPQIDIVDNRTKHRVIQFGKVFTIFFLEANLLHDIPTGPYSLHEDYLRSRSRKHQDSFSDLLDLFPVPPTYIPLLHPVINGDVIPQTIEKTLTPAENCPSPTISEEELTVSSSSGSTGTSSTDSSISMSISISISNETADTSVHEILEIPCPSAIFKVLSSGIDAKDKNISRLTLIQNPEILLLPATDAQNPSVHSHYAIGPKSFRTFTTNDLPQTYHDVVDSLEQADLQKGDISRDMLSREAEEVDTPVLISDDHISRGKRYQADLQSLEDLLAYINLEDSSHRSLDEHMSVRAPVQAVPAVPTMWVRPYVAPLHIVKKKVQLPVVISEPLVTRRPPSGNWEQAMDDVLQAFRDAELEDSDFRGLFSGDDSFLTQSTEINTPRDDKGYLDNHGDEYERQLEESFYSIDESLLMVIAPPDLVLKVEDPANVSLSSERAVSRLVMMEIKDELKVNVPEPRLCDCEGCEDSYSWTAATDDEDDDDEDEDNHSQEEDQWSERLELNEYTS